MIRAACHCTNVRFELPSFPTWVVDCNCSLCRRYGALWARYRRDEVVVIAGDGETDSYSWGERNFAFHWCRSCGCLTYHTALDSDPPRIRAINARIIPTLDPTTIQLQHTDNGHTGFFWTRPPDKFQPGEQAKFGPSGPDDWRY